MKEQKVEKKNASKENEKHSAAFGYVTWHVSVPLFGLKDGWSNPNNKFQIAFGDAYCIAWKSTVGVFFLSNKLK